MAQMQGGCMNVFTFFFLTFRAYFPREYIHPNCGFTSHITLFSALYSSRQQVIEDGAVYKISIKLFSQSMNNA